MKLKLTEEIWKEGNMYISYCPEVDGLRVEIKELAVA